MPEMLKRGAAVLAVALGAAACSDSAGMGGIAHVSVLLTDAPIDYVGEAMVDIGAVVLVPADNGEHITITEDGTDGPVNLLELQDAAMDFLGEADVEAGSYSQLRLIVESASVTLADGYMFTDGTTEMDLRVPSGAQTGIKLLLGPLEIPGGETALVVDFDVSRSFVIQGNPETPAGIHGMSFKPTLRVIVLDVAGSISGDVSTPLDTALVDSLAVIAVPVDDGVLEEFQTDTATTRTRGDGTYTLPFLMPGEYIVRVTSPDTMLALAPDSVSVMVNPGEDVTDVDFVLDSIGP